MKKITSLLIAIIIISSTALASWGNDVIGASSYAKRLKLAGKNSEIIVAVLDTGIDANNDVFKNRLLKGYDAIAGQASWNIGDPNGHGTMMSSIIADCTAPLENVKILPIRVLTADGNSNAEWVTRGIDYAIAQGADVINMSLGWTVPRKGSSGDATLRTIEAIEAAVNKAINKGITVVCAAGNEQEDVSNNSPARVENAIVVASIDRDLAFSDNFSNYGDVDFAAPGVEVEVVNVNNQWYYTSGTSPSTAFVSAVAALFLADNPYVSPYQKMIENAEDYGIPGWDSYYGYGIINVRNAKISAIRTNYSDVAVNAWYYDNVYWASDQKIMSGYGDNTFQPETPITRAEFTATLSRYSGDALGSNENVFTDVPINSWFNVNVLWGYKNQIVFGTGDGKFLPNDNITRVDLATMLKRYQTKYHIYNSTPIWSGENPYATATRAEALTMLRRAVEK